MLQDVIDISAGTVAKFTGDGAMAEFVLGRKYVTSASIEAVLVENGLVTRHESSDPDRLGAALALSRS